MRILIAAALLTGVAGLPRTADAAEPCRKLVDPAARLACYDARHGAPVPTAGQAAAPAPSQALVPPAVPPAGSVPPARDRGRRAPPTPATMPADGRVAEVAPLVHGYWRVTLADGRLFETTQLGAPPRAGDPVHLRRTVMGTTFLDIPGRSPVTVRRGRPAD